MKMQINTDSIFPKSVSIKKYNRMGILTLTQHRYKVEMSVLDQCSMTAGFVSADFNGYWPHKINPLECFAWY